MSNQGTGLHFLLRGMLTKQEETETNTVKLTFGGQPASSENSEGLPLAEGQEEPERTFRTRAHQGQAPRLSELHR